MATDRQIAANRRNSLTSTGPSTAGGKALVRWNALRHGTFSTTALLPGESKADFQSLREAYVALYRPSNQTEIFLVGRLTLAAWRLNRLASLEARVISAHHQASRDQAELVHDMARVFRNLLLGEDSQTEPPPQPHPTDPVAKAYMRDSERGDTVSKFARYQTSLERSYYRALHELERLRSPPPPP